MTLADWLQGIATSMIGSVLLLVVLGIIGVLFSRRARWILTGALGRLLGIELDQVYASSAFAQADLAEDMRRARTVSILAGRGNELQRDAFTSLLAGRPENRAVRVRILLPETRTGARVDWLKQRDIELGKFDQSFGKGLLRRQIQSNIELLRAHEGERIEVRRYSMPHFGRLILTERAAYLTFYRAEAHGRDCQMYRFHRGDFYDGLARMFELAWEAGAVRSEVVRRPHAATEQQPAVRLVR